MDDAEISRRLALAIGWDVLPVSGGDDCACVVDHANQIDRYFDYRDPAVIWPIAERFDCFPEKMRSGGLWAAPVFDAKANVRPPYPMLRWEYADTAAKAHRIGVKNDL